MKEKILLITNIYPYKSGPNNGTAVCHYFARDWATLGYDVRVLHIQAVYPFLFYWAAKLFKNYIAAKTGAVVYTKRLERIDKFEWDGVIVYRVPVFKWWPHIKFTKRSLHKLKKHIVSEFESIGFAPDYICSHFPNPMLELMSFFKQKYKSKTCFVSHGETDIKGVYKEETEQLLSDVDVFGFRSESIKRRFEADYGKRLRSFICYSGVPENFLSNVNKNFQNEIPHFAFLGSLYELKRVEDTIKALHLAFPDNNFIFDIVGDGKERGNLEQLVERFNLQNCVKFYGNLPRNKAQEVISNADYFVMVSKKEAFGLVYLEAMGKGLISIGTKGQGIDGVIRDAENGFLCESQNPEMLSEKIKKLVALPIDEKIKISVAAQQTTANMTDMKMAEYYINSVKNL